MTSAHSPPNPSIRDVTAACTHTLGWAPLPFPPASSCAAQPGIGTTSSTHTHGIPWAAISSDPLPSPCVPGPSACSGHCQRALLSSCQPHCLTLATAMLCMGLVALPSFTFPVQQVSECQAFPTPVSHTVQAS